MSLGQIDFKLNQFDFEFSMSHDYGNKSGRKETRNLIGLKSF